MLKKSINRLWHRITSGKPKARAEEAVVSLRDMSELWGSQFKWEVISEHIQI